VKKIYLINIFLIIGLLVFSLIYLRSRENVPSFGNDFSNTPPNGWKVYNDSDFRFTFAYPRNWFIIEMGNATVDKRVTITNNKATLNEPKIGDDTVISFEIYANKKGNTLNKTIPCKQLGAIYNIECGKEKINGQTFKYQISSHRDSLSRDYAAIKGGFLYKIDLVGDIYGEATKAIIYSAKIK